MFLIGVFGWWFMLQDAEVARMYMSDREQFNSTARFWTETYAKGAATDEEAVSRLTDMGFSAVSSRALAKDCI